MKTFFDLVPEEVLKALDRLGYETTGEYLQLNSYENRVFEVTLETKEKVVVKFYRPQRWSLEALKEEHSFLQELEQVGFPVVSPFQIANETLFTHHDMYYCVFPRARGRLPQEMLEDDLKMVGKSLAHLHNVGLQKQSQHRPAWTADHIGYPALKNILPMVTPHLQTNYQEAAEYILNTLKNLEATAKLQRIHGDCHRGNLLQTDDPGKPRQFFFMDFDDYGMGSVVQDFWMLCAGDADEANLALDNLLDGYLTLREFNHSELEMMEPLRGLRIIHYANWIHRRWEDPSFPKLFPQFGSESYWYDELRQLDDIANTL